MRTHHISADELNRYHLNGNSGPELASIEEHLARCNKCFDRAEENLRSIREKGREHLGRVLTVNLEKYHLGQQKSNVALRIRNHLKECSECADRLLAVERFIRLVRSGVIRIYSREFEETEGRAQTARKKNPKE